MCVWQLRIERQNALRFTFVLPEETCVKMHDHFLFCTRISENLISATSSYGSS